MTARRDSPGDTERIRNGPSTSNGSPSVVSSLVVGRTRTRAERKTEEKAGSLDPTLSLNGLSTATADIPSHTLTRLRRTPNDCFTLRPAQPGDTTPAIHRLPLELLIQVFRIVIEVDKSTGWLSQDRVVKLSLVCRSWRSVVCNTPALWSSVSSNYKLARLKRVVELSKDHFMDVHWVADPLGTSTTNIRLLPAMIPLDRWRSLQANISTRNLALLSRNAAPNLEELDLALGESHNGRRLGLHTFNTIRLFQNSLPKLRHLKLQWSAQYLAFKWDSMVLPSLETFHITTANHSAVPSSTQLMGFLGRSPRIREVQLNLPTKSESAQQTDSQQPPHVVHLSSLQRFHLMSNASYASQVLSKLAAPPSAVMDLTVTLDVAEPYPTTLIQQVSPQLVHAAFLTSTISHGSKHAKADLLLDHQSIALQVSPRTPQNKITGSSKKDGVKGPWTD
ncbi:hypothetical protein FRB90_005902 [Tulasnella sp. 427]|nr:hypothetical protein FRB90_005902 [Tulasnella sp. 427]